MPQKAHPLLPTFCVSIVPINLLIGTCAQKDII